MPWPKGVPTWNGGLTIDDPRVHAMAQKRHQTMMTRYGQAGVPAWNKGLTKAECPSLKGNTKPRTAEQKEQLRSLRLGKPSPLKNTKLSEQTKQRISNSLIGHQFPQERNDKIARAMTLYSNSPHGKQQRAYAGSLGGRETIKRWCDEKFRSGLIIGQWIIESKKHHILKTNQARILEAEGFSIQFEKPVIINGIRYRIDVYAEREGKRTAIECGHCSKAKLRELRSYFDDVIHIPFGGDPA